MASCDFDQASIGVINMKVLILAGGYGTRLSEETTIRPKPMAEIGGKPILWHIMKIYSAYGFRDFIICCGYKGEAIKDFFVNYHLQASDLTVDLSNDQIEVHARRAEPWRVTLVDTGEMTMTGGRMKRAAPYIGEHDFCMTYGDGVSDVNLESLMAFHKSHNALATVTAVQSPGRFGAFKLSSQQTKISEFREKPVEDGVWVNGGFFVLRPGIFRYLDGDDLIWEREPMSRLARDGELAAYRHEGFWHPMDTLRDKNVLEDLWRSGCAPWKLW